MTTMFQRPAPMPNNDIAGLAPRPPRDEDEIPRADNGRPYIWAVDAEGNPLYEGVRDPKPKLVTYTRATTYIKALEDEANLTRWKMRMVAIGLARRPDIQLSVLSHPDVRKDKRALDEDCQAAMEEAKSSAAARVGTALHALTERLDLGLELGYVPPAYAADIKAYAGATKWFRHIHIERFMVQDELRIGGTPDRVFEWRPCEHCGGKYRIGDLKTGDTQYGADTISMQLGVYANSKIYNREDGSRIPLPEGMCRCRGVIFHLPAGEGVCRLEWVDIKRGWERTHTLARQVREHRRERDWSAPMVAGPTDEQLHALIAATTSRDEVVALWREHKRWWTPEHDQAAAGMWPKEASS